MFSWIFALVYLVLVVAIQNWWDRHMPRHYRYSHGRKWRVSRTWLVFKMWILISIPLVPFFWFLGFETEPVLWGTFGAVAGLAAFSWIGCRIVGEAFYGADYRALIADGWDPMFDTWALGFLNRDPFEVRAGQPPLALRGSNWQPPRHWKEKCPGCGAAQPGPYFWCWRCGLGFEHGCQKMCCPDCDMTFCESRPSVSRKMPVTCPGCGKAWRFPWPGRIP
jgi:hypothetical protein